MRSKQRFELGARKIQRGDGIATGEFGNVCIAVWRKDSTMARFELQKRALTDLVEWSQGRVAFCCVVEPSSGIPNEEVRTASSKLFATLGDRLAAITMVIEGTGFRSALVRSVAAGIVLLMGKRSLPISYLSTVSEGAYWLKGYVDLDAMGEFESAVQSVRSVLDE